MKVSDKDISYVADLANLELSTDEHARMHRDLNSILGYIDRLTQLDTSRTAPMARVLLAPLEMQSEDGMRDDIREGLRKSLPHEVAMENAPATDGTFFKVPKVIEK